MTELSRDKPKRMGKSLSDNKLTCSKKCQRHPTPSELSIRRSSCDLSHSGAEPNLVVGSGLHREETNAYTNREAKETQSTPDDAFCCDVEVVNALSTCSISSDGSIDSITDVGTSEKFCRNGKIPPNMFFIGTPGNRSIGSMDSYCTRKSIASNICDETMGSKHMEYTDDKVYRLRSYLDSEKSLMETNSYINPDDGDLYHEKSTAQTATDIKQTAIDTKKITPDIPYASFCVCSQSVSPSEIETSESSILDDRLDLTHNGLCDNSPGAHSRLMEFSPSVVSDISLVIPDESSPVRPVSGGNLHTVDQNIISSSRLCYTSRIGAPGVSTRTPTRATNGVTLDGFQSQSSPVESPVLEIPDECVGDTGNEAIDVYAFQQHINPFSVYRPSSFDSRSSTNHTRTGNENSDCHRDDSAYDILPHISPGAIRRRNHDRRKKGENHQVQLLEIGDRRKIVECTRVPTKYQNSPSDKKNRNLTGMKIQDLIKERNSPPIFKVQTKGFEPPLVYPRYSHDMKEKRLK